MFRDEIVEEIHRIREEYSRSFNHDLKAIVADLQEQQVESGKEVVSLPRKCGLTTRWSRGVNGLGEETKNANRRST